MGDILFVVLRRLRAPLITLIVIYAVAIAGLVLIPGVDGQGKPWQMSFFHAFYVVSYTATTIGFGEIPYPFSDAQRFWLIVVIYLSVVGWAYALGAVFALSRDPVFRAAAARSLFVRRVARLREPYCVVCGYGRSGQEIVAALDALNVRVVVVDLDTARLDPIAVQPFVHTPLTRVGDARRPEVLRDAGIARPQCRAVIAVTGDEEANQAIALGTRALDPSTHIMARVTDPVIKAGLAEFGGIQVIDPFDVFAQNLRLAVAAPEVLQLEEWLTESPGSPRPDTLRLPQGHWVLAGTARFLRPISQALDACGQTAQTLAATGWKAVGQPGAERNITGAGSVPAGLEDDLQACGIERAVGLVAGTDSDTVNLAIAAMARRANPMLTVVMRQNQAYNRLLVEASRPALTFVQSRLMAHEVLQALTTPLLDQFLDQVRHADPTLANEAAQRLEAASGLQAPLVWTFECDADAPGLAAALAASSSNTTQSGSQASTPPLTLADLLIDPRDGSTPLRALALMRLRHPRRSQSASVSGDRAVPELERPLGWTIDMRAAMRLRAMFGARSAGVATVLDRAAGLWGRRLQAGDALQLLPAPETVLEPGDEVLFAGVQAAQAIQQRFVGDPSALAFVRSGIEPPRSAVFRWWAARSARAAAQVSFRS